MDMDTIGSSADATAYVARMGRGIVTDPPGRRMPREDDRNPAGVEAHMPRSTRGRLTRRPPPGA